MYVMPEKAIKLYCINERRQENVFSIRSWLPDVENIPDILQGELGDLLASI